MLAFDLVGVGNDEGPLYIVEALQAALLRLGCSIFGTLQAVGQPGDVHRFRQALGEEGALVVASLVLFARMQGYGEDQGGFPESRCCTEHLTVEPSEVNTNFPFAFIFQVMDEPLRPASLGEIQEGRSGFQRGPAPETFGEGIVGFQVKSGPGQFVVAADTDAFLLWRQVAAAGQAEVGIKEAEQVIQPAELRGAEHGRCFLAFPAFPDLLDLEKLIYEERRRKGKISTCISSDTIGFQLKCKVLNISLKKDFLFPGLLDYPWQRSCKLSQKEKAGNKKRLPSKARQTHQNKTKNQL